MLLSEFCIGSYFYSNGHKWYCTDIGSRVVIAIKILGDDKAIYDGPPYSLPEIIFDETDIRECTPKPAMNSIKTWPSFY